MPSASVIGGQGAGVVIAQSAVAVPHTGDTTETILATIAIPAGAIGKNGRVVIDAMWSNTNSANNKTERIRFGASGSGTGATVIEATTTTTAVVTRLNCPVANRGATNSQVGGPSGSTPFGSSTSTPVTTAIDTTVGTEINLTGQLALGSETITLEAYAVVLYAQS